jgi:putative tryptophan/tyrosine transport system substrate-binding protein
MGVQYPMSTLGYRAASDVTRWDVLIFLCGAAITLSGDVLAQRPVKPVIGFLHSGQRDSYINMVTEFRRGLRETGYVEDQDVAIEFRWANNRFEQLSALATDLVNRQVSVIFASGGPLPTYAAKDATSKIPIVFAIGDDPIWHGFVSSWSHPGGNVTGVTTFTGELTSKRFELLCELVPHANVVGYIFDPRAKTAEPLANQVREAARALKRQVITLKVTGSQDLETAFVSLVKNMAGALFVGPYPILSANRDEIVRLAAYHKIPAIYPDRAYVLNGGLMSYGASIDNYYQGGLYVGKILMGAKPADLPVQQPTKHDLVINLTTAKVLGLDPPRKLLLGASEVVE